MKRLLLLAASLAILAPAFSDARPRAVVRHGHALVKEFCARCHAIGRSGKSPHAGAPPFRRVGRSYDLDRFATRLEHGISAGHPDMPEFVFTHADARAVQAYLRSIQR